MCLKTDQRFVETKNLAAHRSRVIGLVTTLHMGNGWVGPYYHPGPLCICHLEGRFTRPVGTRSTLGSFFNLSSMACGNGTVKDLGIAGLRLLYTCLPLSLMAGKQAADQYCGIQMKLLIFRLQSKSTRGPHKTHFEKYKRRYYYYKIYTRYIQDITWYHVHGQREQAFQRSGCFTSSNFPGWHNGPRQSGKQSLCRGKDFVVEKRPQQFVAFDIWTWPHDSFLFDILVVKTKGCPAKLQFLWRKQLGGWCCSRNMQNIGATSKSCHS